MTTVGKMLGKGKYEEDKSGKRIEDIYVLWRPFK
jgi:hypothetical protein